MPNCACGCGKPTKPHSRANKRAGVVKGQPAKWLYGHQHRVYQENSFNAHEPAWYRERQRGQ